MVTEPKAGRKDALSCPTFLWNLQWSRAAEVLRCWKGMYSLEGLDRLSAISTSEMCKKSRKTASTDSSVNGSFQEEARRVLCKANCITEGCLGFLRPGRWTCAASSVFASVLQIASEVENRLLILKCCTLILMIYLVCSLYMEQTSCNPSSFSV